MSPPPGRRSSLNPQSPCRGDSFGAQRYERGNSRRDVGSAEKKELKLHRNARVLHRRSVGHEPGWI